MGENEYLFKNQAGKKYKTIYADPPWITERGGGKIKRGADKHYQLMKTENIVNLPIDEIADVNCHLYLWVTNKSLPLGLEVMKAWGFEYITAITWVKDRIGLGQYYRGMTEHCLFGRKGMLPYKLIDGKRAQGRTVIIEPKSEHSRKPKTMREMIEKVSYAPRIELFARERFDGWEAWGNEV